MRVPRSAERQRNARSRRATESGVATRRRPARSNARASPHRIASRVAAALLLFLALPAAAGTERYGDLTVSIGDAASPPSPDGYVAYPVTVRNDGGVGRRVTIRLPERSHGGGDHLESIARGFEVGAGGTVRAELLLPPLDQSGSSSAAVIVDGVRQRDGVSFLGARGSTAPPGFLVSRSLDREERSRLDAALATLNDPSASASSPVPAVGGFGGGGGGFGGGYGGGYGSGYGREDVPLTAAESVEQWSRSWLGYTSFSAVLLAEADLARMPAAVASALRQWTIAGGQLVVLTDGSGGPHPLPRGWPEAAVAADEAAAGLGRVAWWAPGASPRAEDAAAGAWMREALDFADARSQPMDAVGAEGSFPVIEGLTTPVRGLVLLMLLFSVLIGPVNILLLAYFKRRMWLLWTVPLGSAVFSLGVVAFAFLSEGISPKARTQAVTWLDQTTREAVTLGMRGYYAPLTPGDGLRFPMTTRIVPQVERNGYGDGGRGRSVDQTSVQHLTRGWVAARVPAHLELTDVSDTRLRLGVEALPGGGIAVTNGFGVGITGLALVDTDGNGFRTGAIGAGERVELGRAPGVEESAPGATAGLIRNKGWQTRATPGAERTGIEAGTYEATLDRCPFLADGIDGLAEHRVEASVLGRWAPAGGTP